MNGSKMRPEVKRKWLDALRSGEYSQGRRFLAVKRQANAEFDYCCLGVLCDLAVKEGVIEPPVIIDYWRSDHDYYPASDDEGYWVQGYKSPYATWDIHGLEARCLPESVMEWAGLDSTSPGFEVSDRRPDDDGLRSLAGENDSGRPFDEIADLIEEHF